MQQKKDGMSVAWWKAEVKPFGMTMLHPTVNGYLIKVQKMNFIPWLQFELMICHSENIETKGPKIKA